MSLSQVSATIKDLPGRKRQEQNTAQQELRRAVLKPEGYRTFASCHVRLPSSPIIKPKLDRRAG